MWAALVKHGLNMICQDKHETYNMGNHWCLWMFWTAASIARVFYPLGHPHTTRITKTYKLPVPLVFLCISSAHVQHSSLTSLIDSFCSSVYHSPSMSISSGKQFSSSLLGINMKGIWAKVLQISSWMTDCQVYVSFKSNLKSNNEFLLLFNNSRPHLWY